MRIKEYTRSVPLGADSPDGAPPFMVSGKEEEKQEEKISESNCTLTLWGGVAKNYCIYKFTLDCSPGQAL